MSAAHKVDANSTISQSKSILAADVGEDIVMLHLKKNAYFNTDDIGAVIWRRIEQPVRVSELVAGLVKDYAVTREQCLGDVLVFLNKAWEEGIISVSN